MKLGKVIRYGCLAGCVAAAIVAANQRAIPRGNDCDVSHGRGRDRRHIGPVGQLLGRSRQRANRRTCRRHPVGSFVEQLVAAVAVVVTVGGIVCLTLAVDLWDDIVGFFGSIAGDVKNFVLSMVGRLRDTVVGWFHDVYTWAGETIYSFASQVWGAFTDVYNWASQTIYSFAEQVWGAFNDVYRWADDAIGAVWNFAQGVWDSLDRAINDLSNWATSAVDFLWHDLIDPLWRWVNAAADFVGKILAAFWDVVYRDVIAPILAGLEWLLDRVPAIWDWLTHDVVAAVRLVEKAWSWLVWFGEHALTDLIGAFEGQVPAINRDELHSLARSEGHWLDLYGEIFDRVLG